MLVYQDEAETIHKFIYLSLSVIDWDVEARGAELCRLYLACSTGACMKEKKYSSFFVLPIYIIWQVYTTR